MKQQVKIPKTKAGNAIRAKAEKIKKRTPAEDKSFKSSAAKNKYVAREMERANRIDSLAYDRAQKKKKIK